MITALSKQARTEQEIERLGADLNAALKRAEAAEAALAAAPVVKPLEWVGTVNPRAYTILGTYATMGENPWRAACDGHLLGAFSSEAEAKAAAQVNFEERIRSALIPSPTRALAGEKP